MAINKIKMSAIAAMVTIGGIATAGQLVVHDDAGVVAQELVTNNEINNTTIKTHAEYIPTLNAGVIDGKLVIEIPGGRFNAANANNVYVYNADTNRTVAGNAQLAGVNKQKLILDINDTINDHDHLYLEDQTVTGGTIDENGSLVVDFPANMTSVKMIMSLVDNNDNTKDISNYADFVDVVQEWTYTIDQKFSGMIDASTGFKWFYNSWKDDAIIKIEKNANVVRSAGMPTIGQIVYADNNVSGAGLMRAIKPNGTALVPTISVAGGQYLMEVNATLGKGLFDWRYVPTGNDEIKKSTFQTDFKVMKYANNANIGVHEIFKKADFGKWDIYGYNAQIPGVMAVKGSFETNLKFTNRSSLDCNIYFTLIDQAGTSVKVDSVNDGIAMINANETKQYKASDLIKIAEGKNANFMGDKSISVEVVIPTNPSAVYGFASFKNLKLGQFKDLPIYNNSKNSY